MKPTQEQIEAALAYADENETDDQKRILRDCKPLYMAVTNAITILAAAYREAMDEIENLKSCLVSMHAQTERDP